MSFVEQPFVILLAACYLGWWLLRGSHVLTLLAALLISLTFYGFHHWWVIGLIIAYCVVGWSVGLWLGRTARRRTALTLGVSFCLLVLCFWKYTPMLAASLVSLGAGPAPLPTSLTENWFIPMGLSFYAFTSIAYMVDVYRRQVAAEPSLLRYSVFICFFPQLVAGPILRSRDFLPTLQPGAAPTRPIAPMEAMLLIARGYFKKMVMADRIAIAIDPFFASIGSPATDGVWSLPYIWLYALQIYLDFSAYTDIARGLGLSFGHRWPENFNLPYLAASIQDFWRSWHITLSSFLRDYLYIPLGGNRRGAVRASVNIMITMLLGGLWHGASWSFLFWGGLHGLMLVVHRAWSSTPIAASLRALGGAAGLLWNGAMIVLTFHCVCLAWCFFRLTQVEQCVTCVTMGFDFDSQRMLVGDAADLSLWILLAAYAVGWLAMRALSGMKSIAHIDDRLRARPFMQGATWGLALGVLLLAMLLSPGGEQPAFLYFQF